jgi:hypothetical protein
MEGDLAIMNDGLEMLKMMADELEMMEHDLEMMEDDLEMMEDDKNTQRCSVNAWGNHSTCNS